VAGLAEGPPPPPVLNVWLSHHYPQDYDRCVRIGRRHVCRRCLVLYAVAALALVLARAAGRWPAALLFLLALPAVVEFVLEQLGSIRYSPARQMAVSVPLGAAVGAGLDRYLRRHTDPVFWVMVIGYGAVCVAAALYAARR